MPREAEHLALSSGSGVYFLLGLIGGVMDILRAILQEVLDGTTVFKPKSSSEQDMQEFQPIAKVLAYADRQGFLEHYVPHKESSTGNMWYDLVMVSGGLSYEGEQFLATPASGAEADLEQIIHLNPSIYGVGVDLWALWHKWKSCGK